MSRRTAASPPRSIARRAARVFDDRPNDPYMPSGKHPEGTRCTTCGSLYRDGRWRQAETASQPTAAATCPACRRTADRLPAGRITLTGPYVKANRDELLRIVDSVAAQERAEHPLNRIMSVDVHDGRIDICTTDVHLPRRVAER